MGRAKRKETIHDITLKVKVDANINGVKEERADCENIDSNII